MDRVQDQSRYDKIPADNLKMALVTDLLIHIPWPNYSDLRRGFVVYWYRTKNEVRRTITASGWKQGFSKKMYLTSCHLSLLKCPIHYLKQKNETDKTSWKRERGPGLYPNASSPGDLSTRPGQIILGPKLNKTVLNYKLRPQMKSQVWSRNQESHWNWKSQDWCWGQENYWN